MSKNTLLVIAGGIGNGLSELPMFQEEVVFVVDVDNELQKLHRARTARHTRYFAVGVGEKVDALIKRVAPHFPGAKKLWDVYRGIGGTDLDKGLAMCAPLGYCIMLNEDMLDVSGLGGIRKTQTRLEAEVFNSVFAPLKRINQGKIDIVNAKYVSSACGGAGGGMRRYLSRKITEVILKNSSAAVNTSLYTIGANTFFGVGEWIEPNAAARVLEDFLYVLDQNREIGEVTRRMYLIDLPMPQNPNDVEFRKALVTLLFQAILCPDVQDKLSIFLPNVHDPMDSFLKIKAGWGHSIPVYQIRNATVKSYQREIGNLLHGLEPDTSVCDGVEVSWDSSGDIISLDELKRIVRNRKELPRTDEIGNSLAFRNGKVYANWDGEQIEIRKKNPGAPPDTVEQYAEQARQYLGLLYHLNLELQRRTRILQENEQIVEKNGRELIKLAQQTLNLEEGPNPWFKIFESTSKRSSRNTRNNELISAHQATVNDTALVLRTALASAASERFAISLLEDAIKEIQNRLAAIQANLRKLGEALGTLADGTEDNDFTVDIVETKPLAEVYDKLVIACEAEDREMLQEILDNCISSVTLAGLATIAGLSPDASLMEFVNNIVRNEPPTEGPDWGGEESSPYNLRISFIVLPPVKETLKLEMEKAIVGLGLEKKFQIASVNNLAAGINIVWLRFFAVKAIREIFTKAYLNGLRIALENPHIHFLPDMGEQAKAFVAKIEKEYASEELGTGELEEKPVEDEKTVQEKEEKEESE